jgi:hypothetical protein
MRALSIPLLLIPIIAASLALVKVPFVFGILIKSVSFLVVDKTFAERV